MFFGSLHRFVFVLSKLAVLGLVTSVLARRLAGKNSPKSNELSCQVGRQNLTQSVDLIHSKYQYVKERKCLQACYINKYTKKSRRN